MLPDTSRPTVPGVVLACGLATLDVLQTVDHVPAPNEKVVARDLLVTAGGPAANAAVTCVALGVRARLLTRIGDGPLGRAAHADLAAHGVDVLDVAAAGSEPPVSTVLVTAATGERAVVSVNATVRDPVATSGGGSDLATQPQGEPDLPTHLWDDVVVLLVDGHHPDLAVRCAGQARRRGIPVVLDGGSWKPGLVALVELVDVAVLSADFAVPDGGADVLHDVHGMGPSVVARSHGADPIEVLLAGQRFDVPVPVVPVVDTLGAGDVLHGALAAGIAVHGLADRGPAWLDALARAAGVASASCAARGARGWSTNAKVAAAWRAGDLA